MPIITDFHHPTSFATQSDHHHSHHHGTAFPGFPGFKNKTSPAVKSTLTPEEQKNVKECVDKANQKQTTIDETDAIELEVKKIDLKTAADKAPLTCKLAELQKRTTVNSSIDDINILFLRRNRITQFL
jgi:hypothetical protein